MTSHWRLLIAAVLVLMAGIVALPRFLPTPQLRENRVLAAAPAWPPAGLSQFRQEADAYVADRFPPRAILIGALNYARMRLGISGSDRVIVGRKGWLFYDDGSHLGAARADPPLTDDEARAWLGVLAGRAQALEAQGTEYLVIAPPAKEGVYGEFGPAWYAGASPRRAGLRLARLAEAAAPGHVMHLEGPVRAVKDRGVLAFSRHDTHWTGAGAHGGYAALMARLQASGLGEPSRPLSDFTINPNPKRPRDLAMMLGVAGYVDIAYRDHIDPGAAARNRTHWLTERRGWTAPQVIDTGHAGKPVLLMTRDSFSNALTPFLYSHFSRLILTHIDDGAWRPELIAAWRPDVVILEVQENSLRHVMGAGPAPSPAGRARIEAALAANR
ncbi:hypothetical protein [uncultured Phenylobacterium sp.]|uniref:alginate O-acetyltransferase AlgX-related protein n=1 Tax=uncultured Phenylobacterium sp. TaxID=349273 RepID=UPI0025FD8108|nr:hypothetical protein [uncultured Phenylobacterium sp.]